MNRLTSVFICTIALSLAGSTAGAQTTPPSSGGQTADPITLPPVTVTAQKEPAEVQRVPVSVTVVPIEWLQLGSTVSDAGIYAPNTYFSEFTARKLTNPRFRGIGASPANPSITTFVDGVPMLNANASNIELMDVEQVEFVRGPQSSLFGRNTLGGVINVASARPSLTRWTGQAAVPFGNVGTREIRANASGPLGGTVAFGASISHAQRDGFTTNDLTGHDLDYRDSTSGKAQLLWTPAPNWETRLLFSAERARDGDYALSDLTGLRNDHHHTARDFEGNTDRDIVSGTVLTRREGSRVVFTTTTGFVRWKTFDATDLDYSLFPAVQRQNEEEAFQFTQEVRFASATAAPLKLADRASLAWQAGAFLFTQNYEQLAVNSYSPFVLSPFLDFPTSETNPDADLDDLGISLYGQGTMTLREKLDLIAGVRFDRETKDALLHTSFAPSFVAPPNTVDASETFSTVSPQFAAIYRVRSNASAYASASRGFKAGGFNPASPTGAEAYDEELAWHVEGGVKSSAMNGRVRMSAAAFWIDWNDLQLNVPNPQSPAQFFIANAGDASSKGFEVEVNARAHRNVDLFGSFGYTRARFGTDLPTNGPNAGHDIPNTPDYTATFGAHLTRELNSGATLYGHGEVVLYGAFKYDDGNLAGQEAYSLANFRGGVRWKYLFGEAWIRNAFDSFYVPVAFAFPGASSGFLGESGRPRTFGLTAGFRF